MAIQINGDSGISGVNGSAGTPALQGTDSNTGIVFGTDTVQVSTGGSTRVTVDSSGNVTTTGTATFGGVGTFSGDLRVQDGGNFRVRTAADASSDAILLQNNGNITASGSATFNGVLKVNRSVSGDGCFNADLNGVTKASITSAGSASFAAGAFAIASDGDITTNIRGHGHLELDSTGSFGSPKVKLFGNTGAAEFTGSVIGKALGPAYAFEITNGTTNMGGLYRDSAGANLYLKNSSGTNNVSILSNGAATFASYNDSSTSGFGVNINVNANTGDVRTQTQSTASQYTQLYGAYFGSTRTFHVLANGNVQNTNNSYSQISDVKLKENIVDANSQWDDLKAVQVRNFNFKAETGHSTHTQIGVVAQEIETVSPGLVYETPDRDAEGKDLDTVTKAVSYSVLYMKAIKALQESMTRVEQLEEKIAKIETLEARVTTLEAG